MTAPLDPDELVEQARAAVAGADSTEAIRQVTASVAGKKSALAQASAGLGALDPDERRELGKRLHEARSTIEALIEQRRTEIEAEELSREMAESRIDLGEFVARSHTVTPAPRATSIWSPIPATNWRTSSWAWGSKWRRGPEIETDWYNFGALNIPPAHPARSMWDTFYLNLGAPESTLLRTHTSPVQIHLMENAVTDDGLPLHAVMPGRCYRRDTPDARHLPVFHQIEGLVVDKGITFADLAGTIEVFTTAYFGPDIHSRSASGLLPLHRAVGRVRGHLHHLPRRRVPDLLADRVDRARGLRHGRPGRFRRGGDRPRGMDRVRLRIRHRPVRTDAPSDRRHARPHRERHPLPASILMLQL